MSIRVTSHRNEASNMTEVYTVEDGESGSPQIVRLDSEHKTSGGANNRVRQLNAFQPDELQKAHEAGGALKDGSDPNWRPLGGEGATRLSDTRPGQKVDSSENASQTGSAAPHEDEDR